VEAFVVSDDVTVVSPAEKAVINELCRVGYLYYRLERFVDRFRALGHSGAASASGRREPFGLYLRALCAGIDEELARYRTAVVAAEQAIISQPHHVYPLSRLRVALTQHSVVLPALLTLVEEVRGLQPGASGPLHGGQILQQLHRRARTGVPAAQAALQRVHFHVHRVLYHQISSWVSSGVLTDPCSEFFIEQTSPVLATAGSGPDRNAQFALRMAMLPTAYLPVALAKKILFIGKAVYVLQNTAAAKKAVPAPAASEDSSSRTLSVSLSHADSVAFAKVVVQLRDEPVFDLLRVNVAMERMRVCVTRHLWELVVVQGDLRAHLQTLRDYFLVGKGEFFQVWRPSAWARAVASLTAGWVGGARRR
jgi:gamma-tubulin complex component 4